jgi:RimJ/RimL family protein N-acetyltransferase
MDLTITALEKADFPRIRDWIDPAVFRIFRAPVGDDQLERLLTRYKDGRPADLGFKAAAGPVPVGLIHVVLDWTNELAHVQQIIVGDPLLRGQGIGSRMLAHALRVCFARLHLHRVQLFVDEGNDAALHFYHRNGFRTDGLMREAAKAGDEFIGYYCLSLLASEWRE